VQTPANAAPRLRARLVLDGPRPDRLGRWVVVLDGRRLATARAGRTVLRMRVARLLAPGTHRLRVLFRPADRQVLVPSHSDVVRIVVRR
jgi:extracellular elastinolytic metalloproteinase